MRSLLAYFLPMLPSLRAVKIGLAIAAVLVAFGAGVKVTSLYYKAGESKAWQEQVARLKQQDTINQDALRTFYEAKLKTAKGRVTHEEIVKLVPIDCAVPAAAVRLLDSHRQRLPETPGRPFADPASSPIAGDLPLTSLIRADADLADLYSDCRSQVMALREWHR